MNAISMSFQNGHGAGWGSGMASTSNVTAYPQGRLHRGTYYLSMFDTTALPYNVALNGLTPHDIRVEALDWASALLVANPLPEETQENTENPTPSFEFPHEHEMDILLASDLIYDRDVLQLFCSAARRLLKGNGQGHLLYVAPQSGRDGLDNLVAVLQAHGIELVARVATPEE